MDNKGLKRRGRVDGRVMNWEIGIDMYTLICIKCMTNKNLLYKKINKIKLEKKEKSVQPLPKVTLVMWGRQMGTQTWVLKKKLP